MRQAVFPLDQQLPKYHRFILFAGHTNNRNMNEKIAAFNELMRNTSSPARKLKQKSNKLLAFSNNNETVNFNN